MFAYDKTFDPEVFLGHCDLISWFSDFALYLDCSYLFQIMNEYDQTFVPNVLIGHHSPFLQYLLVPSSPKINIEITGNQNHPGLEVRVVLVT